MYKIGEVLMHPGSGVCKINGITEKEITRNDKRNYYVLNPVYGNEKTTIFLPVDNNKINIRRLLSKEEIFDIIESVSTNEISWIDDDSKRQEEFSQIIREGDHKKIIELIIELHKHQKYCAQNGKKFRISDNKLLTDAEKMIHQEFAYLMDLQPDEVAQWIIDKLNLEIKAE